VDWVAPAHEHHRFGEQMLAPDQFHDVLLPIFRKQKQFHRPCFDQIKPVARIIFCEQRCAGVQLAPARTLRDLCKQLSIQIAEQVSEAEILDIGL